MWLCLLSLVIGHSPLVGTIWADAGYEQPGTLQAGAILKPEIAKGPHHSVDNTVKNDGMFNHYTVTSEFGDFKVISTLTLLARIKEIHALAEMGKVKTDATVSQSFGQSAENTVEGVKGLFEDPKGTLEGAGQGISSLFNRAKDTIGKRELTDAEDSRVEQIVGISKSKGEIATKYGVNVYSRNKRLQEELNRLARADWLGGLGTAVAKSFIPGVGGVLLTTSDAARLLNETINTTPAVELWRQNKSKLVNMGADSDTVELFLNNPAFSPAQQTVLVTALEKLKGTENRALWVKVALQASELAMTHAITRMAVMASGYHQGVSALKRFEPMARVIHAVGKDGSVIVLLPTDHVIWSEKADNVLGDLMERHKHLPKGAGLEIWNLGTFSKRAQLEMEKRGWKTQASAAKQLSFK
jgi:hypothetical protein